jgi:diguanylate cyclase (GGDEF)-like protein
MAQSSAPSPARQETGPSAVAWATVVALAAALAVGSGVTTAILVAPRVGAAGAIAAGLACAPLAVLAVGQALALLRRATDWSEWANQVDELSAVQREEERRRSALAELGRRALSCTDPLALTHEAMVLVQETIGASNCITNRRLADGEIRNIAATGDVVVSSIPPGEQSQSGYVLDTGELVISNDLVAETRFAVPASVLSCGVHRSMATLVPQRYGAHHVLVTQRRPEDPPFTRADGNFLRAVAFLVGGVLDRDASEQELRRQALEDPLTGLASRTLLFSHLEAELRHGRRLGDAVSVLAVELDRFKILNDTLGHGVGDEVLRRVAARLLACVREGDLVARQGGDEFAVVCTRAATDHAVALVAQRLVDAIREPLDIDGQEVLITASVGLAVTEDTDETAPELVRDAVAAMHRAKELGGGRFEAFNASLRARLVERMTLESDLRHAVEREELVLHYQPLLDLATQRIAGFEALVRWRHPERGLVNPGEFITIAEETGLIVSVGSWVLQTACAQLARWREEIEIAANLSPRQIRPELVAEVQDLLDRHCIEPQRLVLEITESLVLDPLAEPVIEELRALGVRLALDDFGTGYASLGSLQRFPLDVVKLDRTLISSLTEDSGVAVVRAAVELGQALGMNVVAEGIEDDCQLATLRALGCPLGQGFLFARPLPALEADELLRGPAAIELPDAA